ncbi:MAG: GNAT family N-acetyltransferase [Hyphomonadaceae bacterium]|nr:GNAT family N-acetyltransferase [Hyphomonadaceae bacterium]
MTISTTNAEIQIVRPEHADWFGDVATDLFDDPLLAERLAEFLNDPRHHLVVARVDKTIVGFISAVHYVHPDKPRPELWINEVGVSSSQQRRGLARAMFEALLVHARGLGCAEAWVLTDRSNTAAMALYAACGAFPPTDHVMFEFCLDSEGSQGNQAQP